MSPGHPRAARSLLGRMLKGFAALLLLAWSLLIAREVYDVKLAQQRYARAENEQLARGLLLLLDALKDQPPHAWPRPWPTRSSCARTTGGPRAMRRPGP